MTSVPLATVPPSAAPQPLTGAHPRSRPAARPVGFLLGLAIIGVHVALGVAGAISPSVATGHAAVIIVASLGVMVGARRPEPIVAVAAYGGVCDVYWRMTESRAPWEASKYLLLLAAAALLVRFVRSWPRGGLPVALLVALLPGMVIAIGASGLSTAREAISSNEMGFVAFGFAALVFRHLIASRTEAWNLMWVILGPLVAVLGAATYSVITSPNLDFSSESNFVASGGYGPNQVSTALGLIMLICVLAGFLSHGKRLWPLLAALGGWSLWATFLTFSRGGVYSLVIAGAAMLLVGVSTRGARIRSAVTLLVAVFVLFVVYTSANDFTGNWLGARYQEAGTTGRTNIAEMDLDVFGAHPLFGVGSGRAKEFRTGGPESAVAAHTEFTRVLAEHGAFGLAALAVLAVMLVQGYRRATSHWNRLMVIALSTWALTTMLHAATRIGAVAVMLALTQLRVDDDQASRVSGLGSPPVGPR